MSIWRKTVCALLLGVLAACQTPKLDGPTDAVVRRVFDQLRTGDDVGLQANMAPAMRNPDILAQIPAIRAYIPKQALSGRKVIAWRITMTSGDGKMLVERDEYDFGDKIVQMDTSLHQPQGGGAWETVGFHVQAATLDQLSVNSFSFKNRNPIQFLFLLLVIVSPGLMVWALVKVIRTKGLKRKWLWGILAFAGVFSFQMNWATGQIISNWLTVQLIGAGVVRGPSLFDPWVLTMTLPVGAVLILTGLWANPARARRAGRLPPEPAETF